VRPPEVRFAFRKHVGRNCADNVAAEKQLLDHVIVMNERHLLRLMREYVGYYHRDRVHDSLAKDTPHQRGIEQRSAASAAVIGMPRLGSLHHRYAWRVAA
jgi:hypothetical protein